MNQDLERELVQIESLLRRAASSFPYPATPNLAAQVRARLDERSSIPNRLPAWPGGWRQRPAFAAWLLAAAVVALVAALSVPASRSALADFFHLSHVRIERGPAGSPTPPPLAPGNFARPSSVEEARRISDFPVRFPTVNGKTLDPDAAYLQGESYGMPVAIFVYEKAGYDLYETRQGYIDKVIHGSAAVHQISFSGHGAYWVEQGGHIARFLDSSGRVVIETQRSVDRATLIWEQDGITYRLESSLPQAETVAVAESLR
jgi:hypothetical protein